MSEPRSQTRTCLVVGGFGALGSAITRRVAESDAVVLRSTRSKRSDAEDAIVAPDGLDMVADGLPRLDAVIWAHGANINDSVASLEPAAFQSLLDTNVTRVARDLSALLRHGKVRDGARLVVVSSTWEIVARPGKFSYTVSKAALGGLVRAAATDLGSRGILVNGVLPGVVDTPMTRRTLTAEQIAAAARATALGRLVRPEDVASLVDYLCSPANTGVTGQSIAVDLGFAIAHAL